MYCRFLILGAFSSIFNKSKIVILFLSESLLSDLFIEWILIDAHHDYAPFCHSPSNKYNTQEVNYEEKVIFS